jgi:hypothetical protein
MGLVLEGRMPASPIGGARVKDDAIDNYDRGKRGTVGRLMTEYGQLPLSGRPPSRVHDEGGPIADNGKSGTVHKLFHGYGQLPQSARPEPRIRPEAQRNAVRNKGTMAEFMS